MAQYIVLGNWTDQGIREANQTVARSEKFREIAREAGATVHALFWTQGRYDVVARVEAPDDETMAIISLRLGAAGSVRGETLRAFSAEEMAGILAKLG